MSSSKWKIKQRDYELEEVKNTAKMTAITKEEDPLMTDNVVFPQKKSKFIRSKYYIKVLCITTKYL